jgi:cobalamin synthase
VAPAPDALAWFPVVGAALGITLGALWWSTSRAWPPAVAGALVVAADLGLTGMLHVDGLVDAADGLLSHLPRERRLQVMAEPGVGAFGIAVAVTVLITRWAALTSIRPSPLLLAALWCASRAVMAIIACTQPYARRPEGGGLATAFLQERPATGVLIVAVVAAMGLAVPGSPSPGRCRSRPPAWRRSRWPPSAGASSAVSPAMSWARPA